MAVGTSVGSVAFGGELRAPALVMVRHLSGASGLAYFSGGELRDLRPLTLDGLLALRRGAMTAVIEAVARSAPLLASVEGLLAPIENQEVWGAGVTYLRSREARLEEAASKDIYERVYLADRPELFFKAAGWRVVGPGDAVGARSDSTWNVPEPELAILANAHGEIVAYACGNDMSSRSIEGENPLYLPQAKIYSRSCAIGPAAVLAVGTDLAHATMELEIERLGQILFHGRASTEDMTRSPEGLVASLYSAYSLPNGAWLLTGTAIVPGGGYTAEPDDLLRIRIEGLGQLTNHVVQIEAAPADARPNLRKS